LDKYGPAAEKRLRPRFHDAGAPFPPGAAALLIFKHEERLELWATRSRAWIHVRDYPVLAASGDPGPKLREGDGQVPEGVYRIIALNPNSSYHLSMKLDYPNAFDLQKARAEGRTRPGSDIFIHGKAVSIGCVAVGDEAIEELFTLVARIGRPNVKVITAPNDLRTATPLRHPTHRPPWIDELHAAIRRALTAFPPPATPPSVP